MESLTLTPQQAAARLGIGQATMYRLVKAGRVPAIRVGKRPNFRIPAEVLPQLLRDPERLSLSEGEAER